MVSHHFPHFSGRLYFRVSPPFSAPTYTRLRVSAMEDPPPLALDTRHILRAPGACSCCTRQTDRLVCCTDSPSCSAGLCLSCWLQVLQATRGHVLCTCGSVYGGRMSRWDAEGFSELWIFKHGYRSFQAVENDYPPINYTHASVPPTQPPATALTTGKRVAPT